MLYLFAFESRLRNCLGNVFIMDLGQLRTAGSPHAKLRFLLFLYAFLIDIGPRTRPSSTILLLGVFSSLRPGLLATILSDVLLPRNPGVHSQRSQGLVVINLAGLVARTPTLIANSTRCTRVCISAISAVVAVVADPPIKRLRANTDARISTRSRPSKSC